MTHTRRSLLQSLAALACAPLALIGKREKPEPTPLPGVDRERLVYNEWDAGRHVVHTSGYVATTTLDSEGFYWVEVGPDSPHPWNGQVLDYGTTWTESELKL